MSLWEFRWSMWAKLGGIITEKVSCKKKKIKCISHPDVILSDKACLCNPPWLHWNFHRFSWEQVPCRLPAEEFLIKKKKKKSHRYTGWTFCWFYARADGVLGRSDISESNDDKKSWGGMAIPARGRNTTGTGFQSITGDTAHSNVVIYGCVVFSITQGLLLWLKRKGKNVLLWRTCIGSSGQYTGFVRSQASADLLA